LYILFIGAAFLLFIAMVGAIVLTMDDNDSLKVKKNNIDINRFESIQIN
jgi:hypothetical protein